ncbi:MAG: phosphatidate cytidylyltransferase [Bacteroidales bacterium]
MSNFISRTLTGAVFVIAIIGSILWCHEAFSALFFLITIAAILEFYRLVNLRREVCVQMFPGLFSAGLLFVTAAAVSMDYLREELLFINLIIPVLITIWEMYRKTEKPFLNIAVTLLGVVYVGLPFAILNFFFNPEFIPGNYHPGVLLGFFVILWANDTFAFLTGITIGRTRLFERISPKKTWEGTIGGFIFGMAAAWVISIYFTAFTLLEWLMMALLIMIFGTFGDLVESMFKRNLKVKDSGSLLPGHGGLLDRFDAVLLSAPAVFVYMILIH